MSKREKQVTAAAVGLICAFASCHALAATVVQPDIRLGASYVKHDTFGTADGLEDSGGQVDALVRFGFVEPQSTFAIIPRYMHTYYGEDSLEREEQRLTVIWNRLFQTGDANVRADYSRKDLFSSEFEDIDTDPDGDPAVGDNDSGIVGEGTRNRLNIGADFAKQVSQRGDLVADLTYLDITYDETDAVNRVDFDQILFAGGYRFRTSERFSISATAGGRRYQGDNGVDVDSASGALRADWKMSEITDAYLGVGYESLDASQDGVDAASESIVPYELGISSSSERTVYRFVVGRFARPVSTGEFRDRIRASFRVEREMTQRFTAALGLTAYRDEQLESDAPDSSRDYVAGTLDLDWALGRRWSVGIEYFHNQQSFDGVTVSPQAVESRDEVFLNIRFRGLDRTRPDTVDF